MTLADDVRIDSVIDRVDWDDAKAWLTSDDFDNGRSADALCKAFAQSQHVAFAWWHDSLVGMARLLSDGVSNAYLIDVWTRSDMRGRGIGSAVVTYLAARVPGQHIGLQTADAQAFYGRLGFGRQPEYMSLVVGRWLDNDANRVPRAPIQPS